MLLFYFVGQIGTDNLALYGMWAGLIALLIAAFVRSDYVRALATNLREDWLDFANPELAWRRQLRRGDLERLQQVAREGSRAQRLLAVDLLWRLKHPSARPLLLDFLTAATAEEAERLREPVAGCATTIPKAWPKPCCGWRAKAHRMIRKCWRNSPAAAPFRCVRSNPGGVRMIRPIRQRWRWRAGMAPGWKMSAMR